MIYGSGFCPNVSFEDNEFKENKALNDQGKVKDEGTIIVTAQLNLNMSWSLTWWWLGTHHHHPGTFKALLGNLGSWFSVCNFISTQLERWSPEKLENDLQKNEKLKMTSKKMKMEDNLNFKAVLLSLFNNKNLNKLGLRCAKLRIS